MKQILTGVSQNRWPTEVSQKASLNICQETSLRLNKRYVANIGFKIRPTDICQETLLASLGPRRVAFQPTLCTISFTNVSWFFFSRWCLVVDIGGCSFWSTSARVFLIDVSGDIFGLKSVEAILWVMSIGVFWSTMIEPFF